jgi:hypothetical protein
MAAMAVLRQELLLLARELRGEDGKPTPAPAPAEVRVTVKSAAAEVTEAPEPEPSAIEEELVAFPVGAIAAVGA